MVRILFSFLVTLVMLTACATPEPAGPKVHVENAWARPTMAASSMDEATAMPAMAGMPESGPSSAAYFVIINEGNEADTLIGTSTNVAKAAEMHETRIKNDVAEMDPVARVDIPAHGRIEFKPGGYHVMLVGLTQELKVGETLKLTFQFEKSGAVTLDVPIQQEK
jgi:periplasmic copper chaperone A